MKCSRQANFQPLLPHRYIVYSNPPGQNRTFFTTRNEIPCQSHISPTQRAHFQGEKQRNLIQKIDFLRTQFAAFSQIYYLFRSQPKLNISPTYVESSFSGWWKKRSKLIQKTDIVYTPFATMSGHTCCLCQSHPISSFFTAEKGAFAPQKHVFPTHKAHFSSDEDTLLHPENCRFAHILCRSFFTHVADPNPSQKNERFSRRRMELLPLKNTSST